MKAYIALKAPKGHSLGHSPGKRFHMNRAPKGHQEFAICVFFLSPLQGLDRRGIFLGLSPQAMSQMGFQPKKGRLSHSNNKAIKSTAL